MNSRLRTMQRYVRLMNDQPVLNLVSKEVWYSVKLIKWQAAIKMKSSFMISCLFKAFQQKGLTTIRQPSWRVEAKRQEQTYASSLCRMTVRTKMSSTLLNRKIMWKLRLPWLVILKLWKIPIYSFLVFTEVNLLLMIEAALKI